MVRSTTPFALSGRLVLLVACAVCGVTAVLAALALLERIGLPDALTRAIFIGLVLATYAAFGIALRTMNLAAFTEGSRRLPPDLLGMAAAADWLPGVALVALLGGLVFDDGLAAAWLTGTMAGLVVMLVLVAPPLRRSGAASVPDFLARRLGGQPARLIGLIALLATALLILAAEIRVVDQIGSHFFGLRSGHAAWLALAALAVCAGLGGMRGVVQANAWNYLVVLLALAIPAALLSLALADTAVPHKALGSALTAIDVGGDRWRDGAAAGGFNAVALMVVIVAGVASLPHMLGRYLATPSVGSSRRAVMWSLAFLALLAITVPAFAALARWQVEQALAGSDPRFLPAWIFDYGGMGLIRICGEQAINAATVTAACFAGGPAIPIAAGQVWIDPTIVAVAAPQAAGLPLVVAALVAAGLLSAAMATANGTLLAVGNALGGDLYCGLLDRKASAGRHLIVARLGLVAAAAAAAWTAAGLSLPAQSLLAWGLNLAAAGLFPALVLGLWWPRTRGLGATAGMVAGLGLTTFYIVRTEFGGMAEWRLPWLAEAGVSNHAAAIFGLPLAFLVIVAVSLAIQRNPLRTRGKGSTTPSETVG